MTRRAIAGGILGLLVVGGAVLFVLVGRDHPARTPSSHQDFVGPGECDDTGDAVCAAGFSLDGVFYAISCGPVRPEVVTEDVMARGTYAGSATEVRQIAGVDPKLLAAIRLDGGACANGDEVVSPWSMVFPSDHRSDPDREAAACRVTFEQYRERWRCTTR